MLTLAIFVIFTLHYKKNCNHPSTEWKNEIVLSTVFLVFSFEEDPKTVLGFFQIDHYIICTEISDREKRRRNNKRKFLNAPINFLYIPTVKFNYLTSMSLKIID